MNNMSHSAKVLIPVGVVWAMMVAAVAAGGSASPTMWGLVVAALVVAVMGSIWVSGSITATIKQANKFLKQAIDGDYSGQIRRVGEGEMGNLQDSINLLLSQLNLKVDTPETIVDTGSAQAQGALDVVTANVMMADTNFNVVYANTAVIEMLREGQSDIRRDLPNFNADAIVGTSIDQFHANPQKQRQMVSGLTTTFKTDITVGGRTYNLIATPTHDKQGVRTGTVVEWTDKTEQLRLATEEKEEQLVEQKIAAENQRVKQSLDAVTANVMVADADNNIVYMNEALGEMLQNAESDIRRELPSFNARKLMGVNMDVFHKNPAHQQGMVENLKETFSTDIEVGGRTFNLVATPVFGADNERLGTAVEWQDKTEQLAREETERAKAKEEGRVARENQRVKQSLDAVTANVMIADAGNNIVYMNDALGGMLRNAESDVRKELPNFDANKLMGVNMDTFHKNPSHQQRMIGDLRNTFKTEIEVGGRTFSLIANPVFNDSGERLGTAVEWRDRTEELAVEREVESIVDAAASGDLSQRIDMQGKQGFFKVVGTGINRLTDICDNVINDTIRVLGAMAEGKLTQKIDAEYEGAFAQLKEDANAATAKFVEVVGEIQETADAVYSGSNEISAGNQSLSQRTEEQASSLEETASSMEEMTSTIKQNSDNANQANQLASGARSQAEKGGLVVKQAVTAMEEINVSSKKVADIIGVIDEIAFQTNLLALNAAVEAARAGEQGRGFAVVASEVRNLAQRSATAAKEIKELIQDSVVKVTEGGKLVDETGETLEEIVTAVKKVSDIIAEIAAASQEQTAGIDQVNQAIMQLDEMTQQNAALVEEAAATSESMSDQAQNLNELIGFFDTGSGSNTAAPKSSAKPSSSVTRISRPAPRSAPAARSSAKKTGTDDDWSEF